jgi:hypothetical protein
MKGCGRAPSFVRWKAAFFDFGMERIINGQRKAHIQVDLESEAGTPVWPLISGMVVRLTISSFRKSVILDHGWDYTPCTFTFQKDGEGGR